MKIAGFQHLSLIDYPDHVAAVIFTQGCNFRCPYCHNPELVGVKQETMISEEEVLGYLSERKGKIEGLVITGGEPTLQGDLRLFIQKVKALGVKVKLDSNGSNPKLLQKLIDENLVDYIAMDVKAPLSRYKELVKYHGHLRNLQQSQKLLLEGRVPYEFRTTVVKGDLTHEDFRQIGEEILGAELYTYQFFRPEVTQDPTYSKREAMSEEEALDVRKIMEGFVQRVEMR